ncbi:hypothetical protein D3C71_1942400 [compost metagenome]
MPRTPSVVDLSANICQMRLLSSDSVSLPVAGAWAPTPKAMTGMRSLDSTCSVPSGQVMWSWM